MQASGVCLSPAWGRAGAVCPGLLALQPLPRHADGKGRSETPVAGIAFQSFPTQWPEGFFF